MRWLSILIHQSEISLWLGNYGGRSLTGMNRLLWTREIHTHELHLTKWEKSYLKSNYNFFIIIEKESSLGRALVYPAPGPRSSGTTPLGAQSLDVHRLHAWGLILEKKVMWELLKGNVCLIAWGRKDLPVLDCSLDWWKNIKGFDSSFYR